LKLIKDGIDEFLWDVLCKLNNEDKLSSFNLVGGTALSLQIGHRVSVDIDLFSMEKLNHEEIINIAKKINKDVKIMNSSNIILQIALPENKNDKILKVDFVNYEYPLIKELVENDDGIRLVSKEDISAMKMSALGTRGYEARDFVDMYYLLKEMSIEQIVNNFMKKYNEVNVQHY